jgi:hypothetical protein
MLLPPVRTALFLSLLMLAGCHHPQVLNMQNGQHSITATAPSGGFSGSREQAIEQANDYCAHAHQQAELAGFFDKSELGAKGEHTSTLIFNCVAPHKLQF